MIHRSLPLFLSLVSLWALGGCAEESVDTSSSSGGSSAQAGKGGSSSAGSAGSAGSGDTAGASAGGQGGTSGGSGQGGAAQAGSAGSGQAGDGGSGQAGDGGAAQAGGAGAAQAGSAGSGQAGGEPGGQGGTSGGSGQGGGSGGPEIPASAVELCGLVNAYRKENGLPEIPLSTALMTVAAYHVQDLQEHPEATSGSCNLHSWSDNPPLWNGCCYTPDHAKAQCMWDKPGEITASWGANKYSASGYENSAAGVSSPAGALGQWKGSSAHNEVILNQGIWASKAPWPALGCGMAGGYAVLWFGDAKDPQPFQP